MLARLSSPTMLFSDEECSRQISVAKLIPNQVIFVIHYLINIVNFFLFNFKMVIRHLYYISHYIKSKFIYEVKYECDKER